MNALPTWRRSAVKLAQHAAWVLPGARSAAGNRTTGLRPDSSPHSWANAMRRELDYIEDDRAALRWAFGCVLASYQARLAAGRAFIGARDLLRHAAACGALMVVIGFALLENAESQTEPPRPAVEETACRTSDTVPGAYTSPGSAARNSRDDAGPRPLPDPAHEAPCAGQDTPAVIPETRAR